MRIGIFGGGLLAREAAGFLKTSVAYVFKMVKQGELPVTRRGKRYTRLMKSDLVDFLQRHRKEAMPEEARQ